MEWYLWNLSYRKHWRLRLAVLPVGLVLILWGVAARDPAGIYLALALVLVTTVPYMRSDLRTRKEWRARRAGGNTGPTGW